MTTTNVPIDLLSVGLYSPVDASRLLSIPVATLRRWVEGYSFPLSSWSRSHKPAVFARSLPRVDGALTLTFLDLVQLRVVQGFRTAGVPLQRIRVAAETAAAVFDTSHPLAFHRFRTDGRDIFADAVEKGRDWGLVNLSASGQKVFPEVVEQSLREISYATETGLAARWHVAGPGGGIVVDPRIAFGEPVVEGVNVPTRIVWEQSRADNEPEALAAWFRIGVKQVRDALRYEAQLARAA